MSDLITNRGNGVTIFQGIVDNKGNIHVGTDEFATQLIVELAECFPGIRQSVIEAIQKMIDES